MTTTNLEDFQTLYNMALRTTKRTFEENEALKEAAYRIAEAVYGDEEALLPMLSEIDDSWSERDCTECGKELQTWGFDDKVAYCWHCANVIFGPE